MMSLYAIKDYFTYFDVADYLKDCNIHHFDLKDDLENGIFSKMLLDFIIKGELTPYFYTELQAEYKIYRKTPKNNKWKCIREHEYRFLQGDFVIDKATCSHIFVHGNATLNTLIEKTKDPTAHAYKLIDDEYIIYLLDMRFDKTEISNIFKPLIQSNPQNKEIHPRTANTASKIIGALAIEMLGMDLSKPYSDSTNGEIKKALNKMGVEVSTDTIAYWLKLAFDNTK